MCKILLGLLAVLQLNAQEILFQGHVYNKKNKQPIPYVNLSFLNTLKGTSTDEKGHFFLNLPNQYLEKQVHISSLGYKDTIVDAQSIYSLNRFDMVEESFELDEVVVSKKFSDTEVLNPIGSYSLTSGFSSSSTPWVLAVYFPNNSSRRKYLKKLTVFIKKNENFKHSFAKFRFRVYDVDSITKKPNNNLLRKSIVIEHDVEKEFASIDVSALQIKIPQNGIYVGLEWLFIPSNWYMKKEKNAITNKVVLEDRFAPIFSGVYTKNQNYKVMVYAMGEWSDFKVKSKNNSENLIPAISMSLMKK